tara:strand:- start:567 stop:944 length:378 start_codon:yes stop_codon:yes gene_type:complete
MSKYTFGKFDRLKSKQQIEQLFVEGDSFIEFPLKVVWRWTQATGSTVQIAVSVPKKKLPKAVHRNQMKRLLRESYRQQNQVLKSMVAEKGKKLQMMFIFLDTQLWDFPVLDNKISVTLERLQKKL